MAEFKGLLKSDIKRINSFVAKRDKTDSQICKYSYRYSEKFPVVIVTCEIYSNNMETRMDDLIYIVTMCDRRCSLVPSNPDKYY